MERQLGPEAMCEASLVGQRGVMGLQCTAAIAICVGLRDLGHWCSFAGAPPSSLLSVSPYAPTVSNYCCCACIQHPLAWCAVVPQHLCFPFCTQPLISLCCFFPPPAFWASIMRAVPLSVPGCSWLCSQSRAGVLRSSFHPHVAKGYRLPCSCALKSAGYVLSGWIGQTCFRA